MNGESVDPSTYVLKDGDDVRIVVDEAGTEAESETETGNEIDSG